MVGLVNIEDQAMFNLHKIFLDILRERITSNNGVLIKDSSSKKNKKKKDKKKEKKTMMHGGALKVEETT